MPEVEAQLVSEGQRDQRAVLLLMFCDRMIGRYLLSAKEAGLRGSLGRRSVKGEADDIGSSGMAG